MLDDLGLTRLQNPQMQNQSKCRNKSTNIHLRKQNKWQNQYRIYQIEGTTLGRYGTAHCKQSLYLVLLHVTTKLMMISTKQIPLDFPGIASLNST